MSIQDMSLPPEEFLLSVINTSYKKDFTLRDYYFGEREDVDRYGCESMIYMHARPGGRFSGTLRVYYNRVQLDEFFEDWPLGVAQGEYFDTDDLLNEVRLQLGLNLIREDMISDIIPPEATQTKIRISGRSIVYKGYLPVKLFPAGEMLTQSIQNRVLDGFNLQQVQRGEQ